MRGRGFPQASYAVPPIRAISLWLVATFAGSALARSAMPPPTAQYVFTLLGADFDLPQTSVALTGLQTRDGYIWIGTEGGLARFDGVQFVSFRASNTPAFRSNLVSCLHEDRHGDLWIGTERGLVRRHSDAFEAVRGVPDAPVTAIVEDGRGEIWVGTHGRGLFGIDGNHVRSYAADPTLPNAFVSALFVDSTDRLWMAFDKAEGLIYRRGGNFVRWDGPGRRIDGTVLSIAETPRGTLWFGTHSHRLYRLKDDAMTRFRSSDGLPGVQIVDLKAARDGGLWVVGAGLTKVVDADGFMLDQLPHVPSQLINAVFEDREGTLWLCSRDMGLIRGRKMPYRLMATADGLPADGVKTVSEDTAGNVWLAVLRKGVVRVTPTGDVRTFGRPDGLINSDPWSVFAARNGDIWVGCNGPLCIGRGNQWRPIPAVQAVLGMYQDRRGDIWLGTQSDGVIRYHDGQFSPVDLGPSVASAAVGSFCETHDGTLYIGTLDAGLVELRDGHARVFNQQNGLPADDVRAIFEDAEHRLWVGFRSRGLALRDHDRWLAPNALSEAVADHVTAIADDDLGQLWLGTPAGVMWAPKAALAAAARGTAPVPAMQRASSADVVHITTVWSGPQPIGWKAHDGTLLFATRRGLLTINPGRFAPNTVPPPVHLERITVDNRIASPAAVVEAPPGTREVAIEYTALSFVQPRLVRFKYRLEGYDLDWIDAGARRTAYYTNLPPGHFVFHVQACNNDGVWNRVGAAVALIQQPHFYQLWWFYGLLGVATATASLGVYRWRTAVLRRENEKLNRLVAERTRELELSNTAKTEFLETVSHEIRNPLNGLNGLLSLLKRGNLGARERELVEAVQACSGSLTRVFEEVLAHTRLEHGHLERHDAPFRLATLLDEVARAFAWHAAQNGNRLEVILPPDFADGFVGDENKIKTIVENFVGNAIKYAPGAPIELRAESHPADGAARDVHVEICDHGPGIPADEQTLIFRKFVRGAGAKQRHVPGTGLGLATCEVLARALGGQVGVESEAGRGAVFFLRLPLPPATPEGLADRIAATGTALIVEDEQYNQVVLRGIALELGYAPEVASNAEQAQTLLAAIAFDVVFLDWELPGAKGGDIARWIRARDTVVQPIIIAMTAHDSAEIRRQCEEAGMDEFLRKPYDADQVRRRIASAQTRRVVRGSILHPEIARAATEPAPPAPRALAAPDWSAFALYEAGSTDRRANARSRFTEALQQELSTINVAAAENDTNALARAAHRMYAVAAIVHAEELMAAAKALEQLPGATAKDERTRLVAQLTAKANELKGQAASI